MKPQFSTLKKNHYSSNQFGNNFLDAGAVYKEIGYDQDNLIKQNPGYVNTCATRMSLSLLKSGITFGGRLRVKEGPLKGKTIEPGAKLLADQLSQPGLFGKPKIFKPEEFLRRMTGKKGVVFFWKIAGYGGGHIDLIELSNASAVCHSHCYFSSREIWFWELN